ncbi:DUF2177 family protein [Candidatus Saccharibacteria bacterium]|nr:DUF2177 family protein [Candidatus Saccharibacteria bacterium]
MDLLIRFLIAGGVMGLLDFLWLGFVAKSLYSSEIGNIMLTKPNWFAAIAFYLVYLVGVMIFVINPSIEKNSLNYALGLGALFGLVAYATYDLTNLATIKGFSLKVALIDMVWGMIITAAVSTVTYWVVTKWIG